MNCYLRTVAILFKDERASYSKTHSLTIIFYNDSFKLYKDSRLSSLRESIWKLSGRIMSVRTWQMLHEWNLNIPIPIVHIHRSNAMHLVLFMTSFVFITFVCVFCPVCVGQFVMKRVPVCKCRLCFDLFISETRTHCVLIRFLSR